MLRTNIGSAPLRSAKKCLQIIERSLTPSSLGSWDLHPPSRLECPSSRDNGSVDVVFLGMANVEQVLASRRVDGGEVGAI